MIMIRQNHHLNSSKDIDGQRILEYDWTKSTPDLIQPKLAVPHPSFP